MKKYENQIPTAMNMNLKSMISMMKDSFTNKSIRRPSRPIEVEKFVEGMSSYPRVTWFGHSAFLLELEGKRLFFDPMLSNRPSPVSWAGTKRYSTNLQIEPEELSSIDAIVISHDHYDHLDYSSIQRLKDKTERFIVPLGVRRCLMNWGVPSEKITEHAWGDEVQLKDLTLACMPARHFSGRGLFNRNSTLWCSWVILGRKTKVYYSGDSGYGPHFKEIGKTYGPFDVTLMECGQYDERWSHIHMLPEETVQAHLDVRGDLLIPVHWGAFTLAFHSWIDPVERVTKAAAQHQISIATPKIGETVCTGRDEWPRTPWWREK